MSFTFFRKLHGGFLIMRIIFQEVWIFFQGCPASPRIIDDCIIFFGRFGENVDVLTGNRLGSHDVPQVQMGCPAAGLFGGDENVVSVALQHPHCGPIDRGEESLLNAADKEQNLAAFVIQRRVYLPHLDEFQIDGRQDGFHGF